MLLLTLITSSATKPALLLVFSCSAIAVAHEKALLLYILPALLLGFSLVVYKDLQFLLISSRRVRALLGPLLRPLHLL